MKQICDSALSLDKSGIFGGDVEQYVHYPAEARLEVRDLEKLMDGKREGMESMAPHVWAGDAKKLGLGWHFASQDLVIGRRVRMGALCSSDNE